MLASQALTLYFIIYSWNSVGLSYIPYVVAWHEGDAYYCKYQRGSCGIHRATT